MFKRLSAGLAVCVMALAGFLPAPAGAAPSAYEMALRNALAGLAPMGPNQVLVSTVDESAAAQATNREAWNQAESALAAALTQYGQALDPAFLSVAPGAVPPNVALALTNTLMSLSSTIPNASKANALLPALQGALTKFNYVNQQIVLLPAATPVPAAVPSITSVGTLTINSGNNATVARDSLAPASFAPFNASVLVSTAAGIAGAVITLTCAASGPTCQFESGSQLAPQLSIKTNSLGIGSFTMLAGRLDGTLTVLAKYLQQSVTFHFKTQTPCDAYGRAHSLC
jgi:hypothetical protein